MESLKKVHHLLLLCLSLITFSFAKSISLGDTIVGYRRVYRTSLAENEKVEVGTRISFDVHHVPNPCDECSKPYGNCGVGLKCICHINECRDKVINGGSTPTPSGNIIIIFSLVFIVAFMNLF